MTRATQATRLASPSNPLTASATTTDNTATTTGTPAIAKKQKRKFTTDGDTDCETRRPIRRRRHKKTGTNSEETVRNNDYCEACGGPGRFICCDACPKSFHFTCFDPPMDFCDVEKLEGNWYCRECRKKQEKDGQTTIDKPVAISTMGTLFQTLIDHVQAQNPTAFQLSEEIRNFFDGVSTNRYGDYVDTTLTKPVRYNRSGVAERPDYYRLKDKDSNFILCFFCRKSALKKPIVDCDFCPLHWHMDCLNPPMVAPPNPAKRWMCPNHAEHIMPRQRKVKKSELVDEIQRHFTRITSTHSSQINTNPLPTIQDTSDDVSQINDALVRYGRAVYRIPFSTITLDFVNASIRSKEPTPDSSLSIAAPPTSQTNTLDMTPETLQNTLLSRTETSTAPTQEQKKDVERFRRYIAEFARQEKKPIYLEHGMQMLASAAKKIRTMKSKVRLPMPGSVHERASLAKELHKEKHPLTEKAPVCTETAEDVKEKAPASSSKDTDESQSIHKKSLAHAIEEMGKDSLEQAILEFVRRKGRDAVIKLLAKEANEANDQES